MKIRPRCFLFCLTVLISGVPAADEQIPRLSSGEPDLQGIWTNATVTMLERPKQVEKSVLTPQEAALYERLAEQQFSDEGINAPPPSDDPTDGAAAIAGGVGAYNAFWIDPGTKLAVVNGEIRTALIVEPADGKLPIRPESVAKIGQFIHGVTHAFDGPEQRPTGERCIVGFGSTGGPPMLPVLYNNHYQIVQTPEHIMILVEMNHDARIIRMNGKHLPGAIRPWLGDSIGHWDGDTLVVETKNFPPGQSFREAVKHLLYFTEDLVVTERFTRTSAHEILYEFTVDDPGAFTQPWSGEIPLRAAAGQIYEYACHEGNYALPGILAGARAGEAMAGGE